MYIAIILSVILIGSIASYSLYSTNKNKDGEVDITISNEVKSDGSFCYFRLSVGDVEINDATTLTVLSYNVSYYDGDVRREIKVDPDGSDATVKVPILSDVFIDMLYKVTTKDNHLLDGEATFKATESKIILKENLHENYTRDIKFNVNLVEIRFDASVEDYDNIYINQEM